MTSIRRLGPSFVLVVAATAILLGGPAFMRHMAFAQTQAQVDASMARLTTQEPGVADLAHLNDAFTWVANAVRPSVVYISVKRRVEMPQARDYRRNMPEDPDELFQWFFEQQQRRRQQQQQPQNDNRNPNSQQDQGDDYHDYDSLQPYGSGSGWVYDDNGHIVTNLHVIRDADVIEVKFSDKTTRVATVIGTDPRTDIAVLKVDDDNLHPARVAQEPVKQGEIVFAFGSPFQFEFSLSQGIVSGKGRELGIISDQDQSGHILPGYENFIQTDAAINPGNSGGPLTNIYGQVVGMNTAIATGGGASPFGGARAGNIGLGFAIPSDMILKVVPNLIKNGRVQYGYLGVALSADSDRILRAQGINKGVLIDDVVPGTPAADAGLKRGDVIQDINGKSIVDSTQLRFAIGAVPPGESIDMTVLRDGKPIDLKVTLGQWPDEASASSGQGSGSSTSPATPQDPGMEALRKLGFEQVTTMSQDLADRQLNSHYLDGVLIQSVRRGSVAAMAGVQPGMIITRVGQTEVKTMSDLGKALADKDLAQGVVFSVSAFDGQRYINRFVLLTLE